MAGRPSQRKRLSVWMNGELVGHWTHSPATGHTFAYADSWLANPRSRPLSLSLQPGPSATLTGERVATFFDNLLPDSLAIRKRVAQQFGAPTTQAFDLLERIGRDCVGAVQLLPEDAPAPDVRRIEATPLTEVEIEHRLDVAMAARPLGSADEDELRISIAGAQEKTALLWHQSRWCAPHGATPTTHILKLPLGLVGGVKADFSTSVENEWLCSKIAAAFGLPVAHCDITTFGRYKVLVVERFDRALMDGQWWARLPQEDMCQALGYAGELKYEENGGPGMAAILNLLRGSDAADTDREGFLATQLLFWMLAAPDGHAKNFSIFLRAHGGFRLTPLYDVMSAWPIIGTGAHQFQRQKVKLAMAVRGKNAHYRLMDIQRRHWNAVAKNNAVGEDFENVLTRFTTAAPEVVRTVSAQLPPGFPAAVSDPIFEGLLAQARRLG